MSRRVAGVGAALALAAGLALLGFGTAQALPQAARQDGRQATFRAGTRVAAAMTISMNRYSFIASQHGVLSIHLGVPGGGRAVSVVRTLPGGTRQRVGTFATDAHGNIEITRPQICNGFYTASFAGTAAYLPVARRSPTIKVTAYVKTELSGYYRLRGSYHLVHRARRAELDMLVYPRKSGQRVDFPLQTYYAGAWHTRVNRSSPLEDGSSDGVAYSIGGTSFTVAKGLRCRIRAEYRGDRDDGARNGGWYYVEFV